ncbi:MAG: InlB B-repeat-containing protein, partial [Clostridia bacterium]|nr:InlB B-repeat-containing protein [Clostridia bacterium]
CVPLTFGGCAKGSGGGGKYTVTYYDSDGTTILLEQSVSPNGKAYDWTPSKSGYEFVDWCTTTELNVPYEFDRAINSDVKIYAKFGPETSTPTANKYTVTYYGEDGSTKLMEQAVEKNGKAYNWTPTKEGYKFDGWYKDDGFKSVFDFNTEISADTPLYAKFTLAEAVKQYPVTLAKDGKSFTYGNEGEEITVQINEKAIYVDGRLSDEQIEGFDNVYNSFKQAMDHLVDGTEDAPMNMYIAPYVYWIHNPDSTNTTEAFGIVKSCQNLHITGLTDDPRNVVIAANYGHNEGYDGGNWTMFNITGDGLTLKNLTFGDYCNVDLEYPLNPSLNRPKRTNNVTQGQIASYNGDKLYAENVRFISRLNMMPFNNSKRALYVNCHLESTDDALNGSSKAVYLGCDFEFYSSKPWYSSSGVTLLDCQMKICHINVGDKVQQYLSKASSPYTLVDCRFVDDYTVPVSIGWSDVNNSTFRSYYSNVTRNGQPIHMDLGGTRSDTGVDITGTDLLKAYKLDDGGKTVYNVYNLLRGTDDWDPLGQKEVVTRLGAENVATKISVNADKKTLEYGSEGQESAVLSYALSGPQSTPYTSDVNWSLENPEYDKYVTLTKNETDGTCTVTLKEALNSQDETLQVVINGTSAMGHEAAVEITVKPSMLAAPEFTTEPTITQNADGTAKVDYVLDLGTRADMSRIVWAVCDDAEGTNPITIAVGRGDTPLKQIPLTKAYEGKYLKVTVESKHIRSDYGAPHSVVATTPITAEGITASNKLTENFANFYAGNQTAIKQGFWTVDGYCPADTQAGYIPLDGTEEDTKYSAKVAGKWTPTQVEGQLSAGTNFWNYGTGAKNGFLNYTGLYHTGRGARIMYTPLGESFGDMDVTVKLAPGKTAAQGFGSDYQYMDIMIKFDTATLTGYGVRIYRTSGDSCAFVLMEHKDGKSKEICEPVRTSCFLTECTVRIWTDGGKLHVNAESSQPQPSTAVDNGYAEKVVLVADIASNINGGFCLLNTGTTGDNTTYIGSVEMEWKN